MLDGVRLGEKSAAALAMTGWRDQLYLAWTGSGGTSTWRLRPTGARSGASSG